MPTLKVRITLTQEEARELHVFLRDKLISFNLEQAHRKIVSALIETEFKEKEKIRKLREENGV